MRRPRRLPARGRTDDRAAAEAVEADTRTAGDGVNEQLAIDGNAKIFERSLRSTKPLTANQQLAFDYIRERDGVTVDEVGAWLHAHREKRPHGVDQRCEWCAKTGLQTVRSKGLAPLVTYRRAAGGNLYIAKSPADRVRERQPQRAPTEAELAADPFAGLGERSNSQERDS